MEIGERLVDEQAALRRVATLVASGAEPEDVFQAVTREVGKLVGAQSSGMVRYEPSGETATVVGRWHGTHPQGYEIGSIVPLVGDTPVVEVLRTGEPARIDAYEGVPGPVAEQMRKAGFVTSAAAPITVAGRVWGAVIVASAEAALPEDTERRLGDFAELVGLALASADARQELLASRARIVEAGDAARRKLERNLHDGAQQRLVALALSLRLALAKLDADPPAGRALVEAASEELDRALEELRELARGIHPAVLTERGLRAALETLAQRSPMPVSIESVPSERLPEPVEAAAYYVAAEALTYAARYAGAARATVSVTRQGPHTIVEVADDGRGGADLVNGSGLRGLRDRVEALDGSLEVESPAGGGTRVRALIQGG